MPRQRLADGVADQIRELILHGDLQDGERLPPLDRLLDKFGVSAPTMREALRILEAEELVVAQRGGIGGAVVRAPTPRAAAYTLALVLRGQGVDKSDVSKAITALEPLCAQMCALRPDRGTEVLPELETIHKQTSELVDGDGAGFNEKMLEFHQAIARLSGNKTLQLLNEALENILIFDLHAWVAAIDAVGAYPTPADRIKELAAHGSIIRLIAAGEDQAAARTMSEHIEGAIAMRAIDIGQRVDPKAVRLSG